MMRRRDVVAGAVLGTLSTVALPATEEGEQSGDIVAMERGLANIRQQLEQIKVVLDEGLRQNSLTHGLVVPVRRAFDQFLRTNAKFPDFVEIGSAVFVEIYDWHVRHNLPIQIARSSDNRMSIQFMFTQLILRHDQDGAYVGIPYDRG